MIDFGDNANEHLADVPDDMTLEEAGAFIRAFRAEYPGLAKEIDKLIEAEQATDLPAYEQTNPIKASIDMLSKTLDRDVPIHFTDYSTRRDNTPDGPYDDEPDPYAMPCRCTDSVHAGGYCPAPGTPGFGICQRQRAELVLTDEQAEGVDEPRKIMVIFGRHTLPAKGFHRGYTYECPFEVAIGDHVVTPETPFSGPQVATVVQLSGDYAGVCKALLRPAGDDSCRYPIDECSICSHAGCGNCPECNPQIQDL